MIPNKILSTSILCALLLCGAQSFAQENAEADNSVSTLPDYTWIDFLTNKDCRPFIKELVNYPQYNELYQNLRTCCLDEKPSAWDSILNTFRKEKRVLFFHQNFKKNLPYTQYLWAVPHMLFDIQNTKPVGNQPTATLDRIEQALLDHQIDTVISLMNALPQDWQNSFKNTQVLAQRLQELKGQLDNFNQSK